MSVPLPRQGHWERMKAGHQIHIPVLPEKFSGKKEIALTLHAKEISSKLETAVSKEKIKIPARVHQPHKLVTAAKQSLEKFAKDYRVCGFDQFRPT